MCALVLHTVEDTRESGKSTAFIHT